MKLRSIFRHNWPEWSDQELILAFQKNGEDIYFDALFERYYPLVYHICLNYTANREESKELTLDVFLKTTEQIKIQKIEHFEQWICVSTKNTCLSFLKKQRNTAHKRKIWTENEKSEQKFMENAAFRRLIYEEELKKDQHFHQCLDNLPKNQHLCIQLFFLKGVSYRKIAQENQLTEKQVKSHIQNGKRQLKKCVMALTNNNTNGQTQN